MDDPTFRAMNSTQRKEFVMFQHQDGGNASNRRKALISPERITWTLKRAGHPLTHGELAEAIGVKPRSLSVKASKLKGAIEEAGIHRLKGTDGRTTVWLLDEHLVDEDLAACFSGAASPPEPPAPPARSPWEFSNAPQS